jgi:hypothetical protein
MRIHHATLAKAKKFQITLAVEDNEIVATGKTGVRLASGPQGNKVLEDAITKQTGHAPKGKAAKIIATEPAVSRAEEECKELGWKKTRWGFRNANEPETQPEATTWEELAEELELAEGAGGGEDDGDESDADQSKSIVKAKYKAKYKPTKDKCGDKLSFEINAFVTVEDDKTGEKKVSKKLLKAFAEANDAWVQRYGNFINRVGTWNSGMALMCVNNRVRAKIRQAKKGDVEFNITWPKV